MPSLIHTKHRPHAGAGVPWRKQTPKAGGRSYVYGSYVDEPLALITPTSKYYYHANHLYSVAAITNATGSVVERYRYDTYGQRTVLAADGVTTRAASLYGQQVGFTGRYLDKETGLWYFRARYYSGSLGRFVGRDPLEYVNGKNLYQAYLVPNKLDPSGLEVRTLPYDFTLEVANQTKWYDDQWVDSGVSKEISWKRYEWTGKCCEEWDESGSIKLSLLKKVYEMGSLRIPVRVMMTVEGTGDVWGDASLALAVGSVVLSATGQHHVAIAAEIFSITAKLLSVHGVRLVGQTHTMGSPVFQPDGSGIKYGANINFKVIDPPGEIGTTSTYYTTHKISEQDCTSKNSNAWVDHLVKRNKAKRELEAKGQEALEIGGQ